MSTVTRPRATINARKKQIPQVLGRSKTIYNAFMLNVGLFAAPTITMAAFLLLIQALDTAEQNAQTRGKGLAGIRDLKRDNLWTAMEILCSYVQGLADAMTPANAIVLIESAGMVVAAVGVHEKVAIQAQLVPGTPGLVHLAANASLLVGKSSAKAQFNWQVSADGGKTWTSLTSTPLASTDVPNLTLFSTYSFRVCVTLGKTVGEWTQPTTVTIH
jgi:hypothetical protein